MALLAASWLALAGCSKEPVEDTEPDAGPVEGGPCRATEPPCDPGTVCDVERDRCLADCTHPERRCVEPFTCEAAEGLDYDVCLDTSDPPSCSSTPAGQAVPFIVQGGVVAHWDVARGCIAVTVDSSASDISEPVSEALDAWEAISCSQLCFDGPSPSEIGPDHYLGEGRIHVTTADLEAMYSIQPNLFFSPSTGLIRGAEILLPADGATRAETSFQALLYAVGTVVGLDVLPYDTEVDTVMVDAIGLPGRTALGSADEEAICALYGEPPFCE